MEGDLVRSIVNILFGLLFVGLLIGVTVGVCKVVLRLLHAVDDRDQERNQARLQKEHRRTFLGASPKRERSFLKTCTYCTAFGLTLPFRDDLGRTYCSQECMEWLGAGPRYFCSTCVSETTEEDVGNLLGDINGFGTRFVGSSKVCPDCHSRVRRVWITLFYIPILPLTRYRVIEAGRLEFFSRRLQ